MLNSVEIVNTGTMVNLSANQPVSVVVTTAATSPSTTTMQLVSAADVGIVTTPLGANVLLSQNITNRPSPMLSAPLVNAAHDVNLNPFYLKPLAGNIRVCQGCRGSIRLSDGAILAPPFDYVIAGMERRSFRNASGTLQTPLHPSAAHYHARMSCVRAAEPSFVRSNLRIPSDVIPLLTASHLEYLRLEFGN